MSIKGASEAVPALLSYSERHFQRIDKLYQASYVLEYMSSLMSLLPNDSIVENDMKKNSKIIEKTSVVTTVTKSKPKIFQSSSKRNNTTTDDLEEYNKRKDNDNNKKRKVTKSSDADNDPFFS